MNIEHGEKRWEFDRSSDLAEMKNFGRFLPNYLNISSLRKRSLSPYIPPGSTSFHLFPFPVPAKCLGEELAPDQAA